MSDIKNDEIEEPVIVNLHLRIPQHLHNEIKKIVKINAPRSMNTICIDLLEFATKQKLQEIKEKKKR